MDLPATPRRAGKPAPPCAAPNRERLPRLPANRTRTASGPRPRRTPSSRSRRRCRDHAARDSASQANPAVKVENQRPTPVRNRPRCLRSDGLATCPTAAASGAGRWRPRSRFWRGTLAAEKKATPTAIISSRPPNDAPRNPPNIPPTPCAARINPRDSRLLGWLGGLPDSSPCRARSSRNSQAAPETIASPSIFPLGWPSPWHGSAALPSGKRWKSAWHRTPPPEESHSTGDLRPLTMAV